MAEIYLHHGNQSAATAWDDQFQPSLLDRRMQAVYTVPGSESAVASRTPVRSIVTHLGTLDASRPNGECLYTPRSCRKLGGMGAIHPGLSHLADC